MSTVKKYIFFYLVLSAGLILFMSGSPENIKHSLRGFPDSLENPAHVRSLIRYQSYYPFIKYEKNFVEYYDSSALETFFEKISMVSSRKLKILHFGDSHIQADIMTGSVRNRLQEIMGYGGRGLVFPFKAANTHAAYDYKTSCEGIWNYTRNNQKEPVYDMGMIGATINTNDTAASFRLVFRDGFIKENFTIIKIYCKQDSASFDLKMKYGAKPAAILIDCNDVSSGRPYIQVNLPRSADTLEFFVHKTDSSQHFFECYGLMIESKEDKGVLYNSTGINGAGYRSILRQRLFAKHVSELKPDLVVIDLGANDFFSGGYYAPDIEKT